MRRTAGMIVWLDSREEIESIVKEGKSVRFYALYNPKGVFRIALGIKRDDSEMREDP